MQENNRDDYYPELGYYGGSDQIPEGNRKISPSGLSGFFNDSEEWYRRNIEKSEVFNGNTSTVLGTVVHHMAECFEKGIEYRIEKIEEYLDSYESNIDVDTEQVRAEYNEMYEALKKEYLTAPATKKPIEVEQFIHCELTKGYTVGGSIDRLEPRTIVDYKTCSKKPTGIKPYRLQLLVYAWIYRKIGLTIDTIKVVAIQRRTKTLEPRVWIIEDIITDEDMQMIEYTMLIISRCIDIVQNNNEYKDLIFRGNPIGMFKKDNTRVERANDIGYSNGF